MSFHLSVITPNRKLLDRQVTQVVLPAYDGEVGILPNHEHMVGNLGTGILKLVADGKDYWFMLSEGVYEVKGDSLTVYAQVGIRAEEIDIQRTLSEFPKAKKRLNNTSFFSEDYSEAKREHDIINAQIEVHKRSSVVN